MATNNERIAKNAIVLYFRSIFVMLISLYTSRVVLNALGVMDYGIYNVVGGFVATFGVITNALSAAISRFITYELGTGNMYRLRMVFNSSLKTQMYLAGTILLLAETIGIWFLNNHMVIPSERLLAANYVFQFSILTFILNLINVPFNACVIAHERMTAFALICIVQAILTLSVALLIRISPMDKLVFYSGMMAMAVFFVVIIYLIYCRRNFAECRFMWRTEKSMAKEITGFAGWNFIGAASGILRDQGINIVINMFYGPALNAARGIAMQVSSAVSTFAGNFITAINPQITKNYAVGEKEYSISLVLKGSRLSYYLLFAIALPLCIEAKYVLHLWLGNVPEYTLLFVRLIFIYVLIESISYTMVTLMLATGDIKKYQIIVGGCQMLNLPVAYILLKLGFPPESTIVGTIAISSLCLCLRLYMLRQMVGFPIKRFIGEVLSRVVLVTVLVSIIPILLSNTIEDGFSRLIIICLVSVLMSGIVVYFVGCTKEERLVILNKIKTIVERK